MDGLCGQWELMGTASAETEIDSVDTTFESEFARLGIAALELLPKIQATSGLTLEITSSKRFTQRVTGKPNVTWYDVEGVLENVEGAIKGTVTAFDGTCTPAESRLFLIADERPSWATSEDENKQRFFRYDDSGTVICDFVELKNETFYRTMNVLTDGIYLSQVLMVFELR